MQRKCLYYTDHSDTISIRHLNGLKLDLNMKGTKSLFNNFVEAISNIVQRQTTIFCLSDNSCAHMIDEHKVKPMNMKGTT